MAPTIEELNVRLSRLKHQRELEIISNGRFYTSGRSAEIDKEIRALELEIARTTPAKSTP